MNWQIGSASIFGIMMASVAAAAPTPALEVTRLADEYVQVYRQTLPEAMVFAGMQTEPVRHLNDNSLTALQHWQQMEDRLWQQLQKIDVNALLGEPAWITYGFLNEALAASRGMRACHLQYWPVSQLDGWQMTMTGMAELQGVASAQERDALLQQWAQWPRYLHTEIDNLRAGLKLGYSTPKTSVHRVLQQLNGLLAAPSAHSPLTSPARRSDNAEFARQWQALITKNIIPAITAYRDYLQQEYLPLARAELSVLAHPHGEQCYQASLRRYTGLAKSGAAIFDEGEQAIARHLAQVKPLAQKLYGTDDLNILGERMSADPRNHFASRDEVLAYSQAAVGHAKNGLSALFVQLPQADVIVEPMAAFEEVGGVAHYLPSSDDGKRPGRYMISLHAPEKQSKAKLEDTAFHETLPGHHMQIALAQQTSKAHPISRLIWNSGFGEGWAVYAVDVADKAGLFSSDLSRLGHLIQLPTGNVADPGLHLQRWSREQTIAYMLKYRPDYTPEYAAMQTDRISVMPGQLTSYFAGAYEIMALRREAEQRLGQYFDVKIFHQKVLENGAITLPMLRQHLTRWLEAELNKRT